MHQFKNLRYIILLRKTRFIGLMISALMFMLNAYTFNIFHSKNAEVGILISFVGLLYFIFDFKGY
ncbi:hypothetical protein [Alkaliphilus sp. B6464]|uniref:hypothetical protein n=1 Tax=Alkaliphilus sp. B6464 TaxID=2731219 RepID=UPI001BA6348B|nr:hypothetical protein [Alkaliphilus sp. B6464]QUH21945.1 hypothetical protein HYG84_18740 [Alkaliphilus sp. B6464]